MLNLPRKLTEPMKVVGTDRVQQCPDMVVAGDLGQAEQRLAIRPPLVPPPDDASAPGTTGSAGRTAGQSHLKYLDGGIWACVFGRPRLYPWSVQYGGWRTERWTGSGPALKVWKIRAPAMPVGTLCWKSW